MEFLYDRQVRRFYTFLVIVCVVQICFMGFSGMLQAHGIRQALVERELAAASYLLEQEIPPALLASAWNHTEATEEGRELLEKIGHTEQTQGYLLLLAGQTSVPMILFLTAEGAVFAIILLLGAGAFLRSRERVYGEAERVVTQYAEGGSTSICRREEPARVIVCSAQWKSLRCRFRRRAKPSAGQRNSCRI